MRNYNKEYKSSEPADSFMRMPSFCVGDTCDVRVVSAFVESMEWDTDKTYPAFELWLMYADYCRENGVMPTTQYRFSRELVAMGYEKLRKTSGMAFRMVSATGGSEDSDAGAMISADI